MTRSTLAGTNTVGGTLAITSGGMITDSAGTSLSVTGAATLVANAGTSAITLGDDAGDTTNFGSLDLTGSAVTVSEDSGTVLAGVSASSLDLTSNGAITDSATTSLVVTNTATFNAGSNAITLGDNAGDTTNFGSLDLTGSAVTVSEDSASQLDGLSVTSLDLTSTAGITDGATSTLTASGNVALTAGTTISIGGDDDTVNFGSVTLNGTMVSLTEDDGTQFTGTSSASTSLTLTSAGDITDTTNASLTVGGNAALSVTDTATQDITLGEAGTDNLQLGSVTVSANNVALSEDDATVFSGTNTAAGTLTVTSGGTITDLGDDDVQCRGVWRRSMRTGA
ncbi:MAG: hypothetical protein U5O39_19010 [Gammaproteobacteria bacterium]|nr:hypothetical protein [Gammaproteobacteria bacterium]